MAKTLADIWAENKAKQAEAGHAQLRAQIGKRGIWSRVVDRWHSENVAVTIIDVKFGKMAWFIVRDDDGKETRVKPHNVNVLGEPADYCQSYGDCRLCDGRAGQCTCTCHAPA